MLALSLKNLGYNINFPNIQYRNNYLEYIVTNYLTINEYQIHNLLK